MGTKPSGTDNTPTSKKVGMGMWVLFWCILLAALLYFFAYQEEQQLYPNQHIAQMAADGKRQINLAANRYGHYTLTGKINGSQASFLIDTGATEVVVPSNLAQQLDLPQGYGQRVRTANGTITVYQTTIDKLELGPIVLRNVRASINPYMEGDILLGMSALGSLDITQKNKQLQLRQHSVQP